MPSKYVCVLLVGLFASSAGYSQETNEAVKEATARLTAINARTAFLVGHARLAETLPTVVEASAACHPSASPRRVSNTNDSGNIESCRLWFADTATFIRGELSRIDEAAQHLGGYYSAGAGLTAAKELYETATNIASQFSNIAVLLDKSIAPRTKHFAEQCRFDWEDENRAKAYLAATEEALENSDLFAMRRALSALYMQLLRARAVAMSCGTGELHDHAMRIRAVMNAALDLKSRKPRSLVYREACSKIQHHNFYSALCPNVSLKEAGEYSLHVALSEVRKDKKAVAR